MLHVGTVKSMYLRRGKKRTKTNIHVYYVILASDGDKIQTTMKKRI